MQYRNQSLCGCHSELWIADSFCGTDQQHQGGSWKWLPALASPFLGVMCLGMKHWLMSSDKDESPHGLDYKVVARNEEIQDPLRENPTDLL